ncbi:MAG TPA: hypothetical protein VEQ61_09815 [Thermoleophilaceae bacterium]|nr:hypothetical protein [Thermoleophilaceae bacterium]
MAEPLIAGARSLLERNWREGRYRGRDYAFSVPSPRSYPWQWYWDSCFHAIVRRRFDPEGARRELETLLAASDDGFIGHTIFWAQPVNFERSLRYNVARRSDLSTRTIQPPLLAWAWRIVVGDPAEEPRIARHHEWLLANRDLEGDGLLWIVQPDESGMDASPKFDHAWGRLAQGRPLFPLLIARNRRLDWDARRVRAAGRPVACEVVTNVLWSLAQQALGRPSPTPALVERLWHERQGRFLDDVRNPARGPLAPAERPLIWDTLAPLALPDLPERIGRRLVEEVLLSPAFLDAVPIPSVALGDPAHSSKERFWGLHRHWRGPSWVNSAWFVWLGLRRLGYEAEAERLGQRLATTMRAAGFREYYEARQGYGMGARDFGWSTLIWELLDPAPGSQASYLGGGAQGASG